MLQPYAICSGTNTNRPAVLDELTKLQDRFTSACNLARAACLPRI